MDERSDKAYRASLGKKGLWIGLGALGIIFLCLLVCGSVTLFAAIGRCGPVQGIMPHVQAPAGEEGIAPPAGHGLLGVGRYAGWGLYGFLSMGLGILFKLLLLGFFLLLLFRLIGHLFWGHCYHGPHRWQRPPRTPVDEMRGEEGDARTDWGPRSCRHARWHWGPPPWYGPQPEQDSDRETGGEQPDEAAA